MTIDTASLHWAAVVAAAENVADRLDSLVGFDVGVHFGCSELEALCELFEALGRDKLAEDWRQSHRDSGDEEPDDLHFDEANREHWEAEQERMAAQHARNAAMTARHEQGLKDPSIWAEWERESLFGTTDVEEIKAMLAADED